jgi:cell wall-associated NlpC family hydrolase
MLMNKDRENFLISLMQDVGKPYIFGDEGKVGFDCSGLVMKHMPKTGLTFPYDMNANSIMHFVAAQPHTELLLVDRDLGDLAFFGDKFKITHVGICLNNEFMIEARGGNSSVDTINEALELKAKVEVTQISHRKDLYTILRSHRITWFEPIKEMADVSISHSSVL